MSTSSNSLMHILCKTMTAQLVCACEYLCMLFDFIYSVTYFLLALCKALFYDIALYLNNWTRHLEFQWIFKQLRSFIKSYQYLLCSIFLEYIHELWIYGTSQFYRTSGGQRELKHQNFYPKIQIFRKKTKLSHLNIYSVGL